MPASSSISAQGAHHAEAEARRLLRVLLFRLCAVPLDTGGTCGDAVLLRADAIAMTKTMTANDWMGVATDEHIAARLRDIAS
jgi:hypothetical protein